jgi:hypothetical protein
MAPDYHLKQSYVPFSGARIIIYCKEEEERQCRSWPTFAYIKVSVPDDCYLITYYVTQMDRIT